MPRCEQCGTDHPLDDLELTFLLPDDVANLTPEERSRSVQEDTDLCVLEGQRFFIRALLPLAVAGRPEPYNIGIWVEVSRRSFERIHALWDEPDQADEPPFSAMLANHVPMHPQTLGLEAVLNLTGPTTRPEVTLSPAGHPLVAEQVNGISAHRAHEYSSRFARSAAQPLCQGEGH